MDKEILDYIKSIKPGPHLDGMKVLQEGIEIGKTIQTPKSRFSRESGFRSYLEYKKHLTKEGRIYWNILMGLATVKEQVEAIKKIYEFMQRTGFSVDTIQPICSGKVALPKEYRDKAPSTTSFVMETFEDYLDQVEAAPIENTFCDYVLASPNGLETTIWSLKAGASFLGVFSQIIWSFPPYEDDLTRFVNMVKCLGMMASKYDEEKIVFTYLEDGLSGYFLDCVSYVGHAMMEHYICTRLCGARYMLSFGGLLSDCDLRGATAVALHKALSTEDQPVLHYINSSTNLQWDHDIHGNYGMSAQELLFSILLERKYRMGLGANPVSITEKIAVPTLEELLNIFTVGKRIEEKAPEWDEFMDFSKIDEMSDIMVAQGRQFFENLLEGFREAGINIEDPLEMILAIRNLNPLKFEHSFHPTTFHSGNAEVKPFFPTILGKQTVKMRDDIIKELEAQGFKDALKGKKVIVASGDAHTYGLLLVEGVLGVSGAQVVNGGVDMHAADLLDLADEENTNIVAVSCHNGQALDYGRMLVKLAQERGRQYQMCMGGVLNSILPGHTEPVNIAGMLTDIGIFAQNDLVKTVEKIKNS
jgi:methylmalonyl-CoA mutase cobalamin-binding subunit